MFRHKEIDHLTDKIVIRKSIISRIEQVISRVTNRAPNLTDRTGHESPSQISRIERVTIVSANWTSVSTRVLQHPWGQRDSIMPRSKEDDVARKREERSERSAEDAAARLARSADDSAARSADDAARKREDLLLRMALFIQARIPR